MDAPMTPPDLNTVRPAPRAAVHRVQAQTGWDMEQDVDLALAALEAAVVVGPDGA